MANKAKKKPANVISRAAKNASRQVSYSYPFGAKYGTAILWGFISLFVAALLFGWPEAIFDLLEGKASQNTAWSFALSLGFSALFFSYAVNLYPNVVVQQDGLLVDYFWSKRRLLWEEITRIDQTKNFSFTIWVVESRALTFLHRFYGLLYLRTFRPSFLIFSTLPEHGDLVKTIERHLEKQA